MQEKTETIVTEGSLKRPGGFYANIPSREYHSSPGLSYSGLKNYAVSPAYYKAMRECERVETDKIETMIHLVLEDKELFDSSVMVIPDRRTKAGRTALEEARERDMRALTQAEYDHCLLIRHSVETDLDAGAFLKHGESEMSMFWEDHEEEGLLCRGRADRLIPEMDLIVDWKCVGATLSNEEDLRWLIHRQKWAWQSAFYSDGYKALTGREAIFANVFLDHRSIWKNRVPVLVKCIGTNSLDFARDEYRFYVKEYKRSLDENAWSGLTDIDLPERVVGL